VNAKEFYQLLNLFYSIALRTLSLSPKYCWRWKRKGTSYDTM